MLHLSLVDIKTVEDRVKWLKDKVRAMRVVGGPDYSPKVFQDRTDGEIGGLEWVLNQCKK